MLRAANGQESNKGNLHTRQRAEGKPRGVTDVEPGAVASHADQNEGVQGQQIGDEDISTPRRDHVSVKQRGQRAPEHGAVLDSLNPQEEGEDKQEDSNGLVVVTTGDRTRDIPRRDAHEGCGEQSGGGRGDHFGGQEVCRERSETGETWGEEDTDVTDVDWEREGAQEVVDSTASDHQSGVQRATGDTTERMPCAWICVSLL